MIFTRLNNFLKVPGLNVRSKLWSQVCFITQHFLPCCIVSIESCSSCYPSCFHYHCYGQVGLEGTTKPSCWGIVLGQWKHQRITVSLTNDLASRSGQAIKDQVHFLLYPVLWSGWSPMLAGSGVTTATLARGKAGKWNWS